MADLLSDFPQLETARQLWRRGERDAALAAFDQALVAQPGNVRAMVEAASLPTTSSRPTGASSS